MSKKQNSRRNRKLSAIAAGALVIGIGATYTLATWTDSEWVWGGADNEPGVGTSFFNVQQNTEPGAALSAGGFGDEESNPGGELTFSPGALSLSPGSVIYAPVALRTQEESVAGEVTLTGAVPATGVDWADDEDLLWEAIEVSVYTSGDEEQPACLEDFVSSEWDAAIIEDAGLGDGAMASQDLAKSAESIQHYCFVLTLPEGVQEGSGEELMGRTIAPAWEFAAESAD